MFLNLGDSYVTGTTADRQFGTLDFGQGTMKARQMPRNGTPPGLKPKDLVGIPWRVALALQADGWWLRSDIIWAKPNPMPESVTDRPTKAHEYVFLFSKSARYFWDAEAVREPQSNNTHLRHSKAVEAGDETVPPAKSGSKELERPGYEKWREYAPKTMLEGGRNLRSVWAIATHPYSGAHFATFPPALVEPMIKAASKPGDTVLDPFGGAGTAALVAERLGRDSIICELNAGYAEMARQRITDDAPMLVDVRLNS
jgi:DNA modification methylase